MDSPGGGSIVSFNVGGKVVQVYRQTLKQFPNSLLWKLANGELRHNQDNDGLIFIDRNVKIFKRVLDLIRYQTRLLSAPMENPIMLSLLRQDLHYYNLPELLPLIEKSDDVVSQADDCKPDQYHLQENTLTPTQSTASPSNDADETAPTDPPLIQLSVGGLPYTTSLTTLTRYPFSMLGAMFSGRLPSRTTADGRIFIDRDGGLFRHVLNFLRTGELTVAAGGPGGAEFEALAREADFYQIGEMIEALERSRQVHRQSGGQKGVYLEVKDSIICFRGFHISTSLVGPMQQLCKVSPFREEFQRTGSCGGGARGAPTTGGIGGETGGTAEATAGPSLWCNINPFYTAWSRGSIEEVYLNSDSSISRLEWACRLREHGWQLVGSSSCCSSTSDQTYIVVDKWFHQASDESSPPGEEGGGGALVGVLGGRGGVVKPAAVEEQIEGLSLSDRI